MEILLGISILFNVVFAAVALNLYNRGKEQLDEIEGLNGAVIRERRSSIVPSNTIELRKYRHHRSWFRRHYPNQDFDDLIDMLLFMHINEYTDGDSIEYPSDIAYEDINEDMDLAENNQETYEAEDTNSILDSILDSIGTDQEMHEAEDNHSRLRADAEAYEIIPEATYVESSYERSSPSSSYDGGSSSSDSSSSSSSDSGGSSD